jgi:hypothetical protein
MTTREAHHDERDVMTNAELTTSIFDLLRLITAHTEALLVVDDRFQTLELRQDLVESPVAVRTAVALEKLAACVYWEPSLEMWIFHVEGAS